MFTKGKCFVNKWGNARNRHEAPKNRFATVSHHEMTKLGKTEIERENLLDLMQPNERVEGNKATTRKTLKSQEIFSRRTQQNITKSKIKTFF
jgi:hypothetical protein